MYYFFKVHNHAHAIRTAPALGLTEGSTEGATRCRWRCQELIVDVMPIDDEILGFSNRWYAQAIASAEGRSIGGTDFRLVTPVYFVATKRVRGSDASRSAGLYGRSPGFSPARRRQPSQAVAGPSAIPRDRTPVANSDIPRTARPDRQLWVENHPRGGFLGAKQAQRHTRYLLVGDLKALLWRRGWDSNPRAGYPTKRFRGVPVTTTSVPLRSTH